MNTNYHWLTVLSTVKDLALIGIVIVTIFHLPYYYERLTHSYTQHTNPRPSVHYGSKYARDVYTTGARYDNRYSYDNKVGK